MVPLLRPPQVLKAWAPAQTDRQRDRRRLEQGVKLAKSVKSSLARRPITDASLTQEETLRVSDVFSSRCYIKIYICSDEVDGDGVKTALGIPHKSFKPAYFI